MLATELRPQPSTKGSCNERESNLLTPLDMKLLPFPCTQSQLLHRIHAAAASCGFRLHGHQHLQNLIHLDGMLEPIQLKKTEPLFKGAHYTRVIDTRPSKRWRPSLSLICLFSLYVLTTLALFSWKFVQYRNDRGMYNLAGYAICIARGSAEVALLNGFLLLWPVMTRVQYWIFKYIPLVARILHVEHRIVFHITFGSMYYVAGWVHVIAHLVNVLICVPAASVITWNESKLATTSDFLGKPKPNIWVVLNTLTGITGTIMLVCSIIAPLCKFKYYRTRRIGWNKIGHLFDAGMYACTFLHGIKKWLEESQALPLMTPPLCLYVLIEVLPRYWCTKSRPLNQFEKTDDGSIILHLPKSRRFENALPGSFLRLNVPDISSTEWHPFSITSEGDQSITVNIQPNGDWTSKLALAANSQIHVLIDGPIPAPAVDARHYEIAILIGAGIGITPYLSILQDQKLQSSFKALYLHWQTNKQEMFQTHGKVLEDSVKRGHTEIQTYLTGHYLNSSKPDIAVIEWAQQQIHRNIQFDVVSGLVLPIKTKLSRPAWKEIFNEISDLHPSKTIGVFFCGPSGLKSQVVADLYHVIDTSHCKTRFSFHPEHF